ncbi:MAG: hypothetical protein J0M13_05795, partial [Candidatus Accumulibacter sp.]|nr:hypothetical protein [Candidatus Accumulibacter necessarius]
MGVGHEDQCKTLRAHRVSPSEKSSPPPWGSSEIRGGCSIMPQFSAVVYPAIQQMQVLIFQIQNLRRTRDLLLPRLLSGQIDVANLPEQVSA